MIDPSMLEKIGAYQDPADGQYKRYHLRTRNVTYDPGDPKAELKGLAISYRLDKIPHPVILPLATDPESIEEARQKAVRAGADFYHPVHGWLRGGLKREAEAPENLGAGAVRYDSDEVILAQSGSAPARAERAAKGA